MKKAKPLPNVLGNSEKEMIAEMIRVNHAGEYGAKRIYEGQLAVLKKKGIYQEVKYMYEQELCHLRYFEQEIEKRRVRPTMLQPLWHGLGFALGAVTAALGEKAAMACTVAVEDVIEKHYQSQLDELSKTPEENELLSRIKQFREEEIGHGEKGISHKAREAFGYNLLYNAVKLATKAAIKLSKKI